MSEFQSLLDDLEQLHKARPPVMADPDDDDPEFDPDEQNDDDSEFDPDEQDDDDDQQRPMAKAFDLTLEDGTSIPAYDGTVLIKALQADVQNQRDAMTSALGGVVDLLKSQGRELADLRKSLDAIGRRPAGRKSVLNVHERPDVLGAPQPAVNPRDVLNKALSAQRAGKLHGGQVAEIEAHLNRGDPIPDYLARALVD